MGFQNILQIYLFHIVLIIIIYAIIKFIWSNRKKIYLSTKLNGPPVWPIFGNAFPLFTTKNYFQLFLSFSKYKSPMRFWFFLKFIVFVYDPKSIEIILNKTLHKEKYYDFFKPLVGNGLFNAPEKIWKPNRKRISPTFNQKILDSFVEIMFEQTEILVTELKKYTGKGLFDVHEHVSVCALNIICETAMGFNTKDSVENAQVAKSIGRIFNIIWTRIIHPWIHPDFLFNLHPLGKEFNELNTRLNVFAKKILEDKRKVFINNKSEFDKTKKAFLDCLLEIAEENKDWTDDVIIDEVKTFIIAGSDTTTEMASLALLMLAMHPEIQNKVFEELKDILGSTTRPITFSDLPKMTYLECVIKETLRLFPVGPFVFRYAYQELQIDDYTIPKDSTIAVAIGLIHRDPQYFPEPLKFDPDRFLQTDSNKLNSYIYLPFSAGPRNCIGMKFGMMALKMIAASVVYNFKIKSHCKDIDGIDVDLTPILTCKNVKIIVENR